MDNHLNAQGELGRVLDENAGKRGDKYGANAVFETFDSRKRVGGMTVNTKINYLYRDASNYKMPNEAVVAGPITEQQIDLIMDCLDCGEYFIPKQVGLPEERLGEWTEDDHCWFELSRNGFEITNAEETVGITINELVDNFLAAKTNWKEWEETDNE